MDDFASFEIVNKTNETDQSYFAYEGLRKAPYRISEIRKSEESYAADNLVCQESIQETSFNASAIRSIYERPEV